MAGMVFTAELLSQLRSRGIDSDRISQHKARQEGKTLDIDKTGNTKFTAQLIAEHIQNWLPSRSTDPEPQHEITALRSEIAKLKQKLGEPLPDSQTTTPWLIFGLTEHSNWTLYFGSQPRVDSSS